MLTPIVIDEVHPSTPLGLAAKAVAGAHVAVSAQVVADGHDRLGARVRWRRVGDRRWDHGPMQERGDGRWVGSFVPRDVGAFEVVVEAWTDRYATWCHEIEVKAEAGQPVELELEEGAQILDDLAGKVAKDAKARLREAAAAVRRPGCTVAVRIAAATHPDVRRLVAGVPDARRSASARHPLWVDRPIAAHAAWYELFPRSFDGFQGAA
ncbi:MAG: DUF3416 domain-containing protein, partial [Acidimicrobiales bacterium]|nr:DUF3416 domain-containing protein [Acidimicrobiales bacterium]